MTASVNTSVSGNGINTTTNSAGQSVVDSGTKVSLKQSGIQTNGTNGATAILHPIGSLATGAGLPAGNTRTWGYRATVDTRPIAAKLYIGNMEATPPTNVHACVCVSTTIGSPAYERPTGHTWVNITWSGAASTTAPTRTSATIPGYLASDLVPITVSSPRTDGAGYMIFLNFAPGSASETFTYCITNGVNATATDIDTTYANSLPNGQVMRIRRVDGDYATAATGDTFPTSSSQNNFPLVFLELTLEGGATILLTSGDSISMGQGGAGGLGSGMDIATRALQAAGKEVYHINRGRPGQTTNTYANDAIALIPILKPKAMCYSAWSPNDVNSAAPNVTQGFIDTMKRNTVLAYQTFMNNGGDRFLIRTPTPLNTLTTYGSYTLAQRQAMEALRLSIRTWALSLNWKGISVVDVESIYSDGGNPAQFKVGLSDDGLHPNATGYALEAALIQGILDGICP